MILLFLSQHGAVQLPYHENFMDQYVKTMQSDEFHYYKLNQNHKTSDNDLSIKIKCFTENFICILIKQGLCVCGETSHLESYKSTECILNWTPEILDNFNQRIRILIKEARHHFGMTSTICSHNHTPCIPNVFPIEKREHATRVYVQHSNYTFIVRYGHISKC